jgi:SAM-dependent methyltransferase
MSASSAAGANPISLTHWADYWRRKRRESHLKQTQLLAPEKWRLFYDRVSDLWDRITGTSPETGEAIAGFMTDQHLCMPGDSVLDVGCGPGALSFALAERKITVTAIDNSAGMIQRLVDKIRRENITGVRVRLMDWRKFPSKPSHDLAVACFFPDAFSPDGLRRMESLAAKRCLMVFGDGKDIFPPRRRIWEKVMDISLPEGSENLMCAVNYLRAAGRCPKTAALSIPVHLNVDVESAETFYREYFAIFGRRGPDLHAAIAGVLADYADQGRIRMQGISQPTLLWWEPCPDRPIPCEAES